MKKKNNILLVPIQECCGCSACAAICPTAAISMELDEDGFYYPRVDEPHCICCGQCLKVCVHKHS